MWTWLVMWRWFVTLSLSTHEMMMMCLAAYFTTCFGLHHLVLAKYKLSWVMRLEIVYYGMRKMPLDSHIVPHCWLILSSIKWPPSLDISCKKSLTTVFTWNFKKSADSCIENRNRNKTMRGNWTKLLVYSSALWPLFSRGLSSLGTLAVKSPIPLLECQIFYFLSSLNILLINLSVFKQLLSVISVRKQPFSVQLLIKVNPYGNFLMTDFPEK